MPVYADTFTWSTQVQAIYSTDPIKVGLYNFPAGFGTQVGALASALLMRALGHTNIQLTVVCFFVTLFTALQATLTPSSIQPAMGFLSIAGLGNGFIQTILPAIIQLFGPDSSIGYSSGLLILLRLVGGAASSKLSDPSYYITRIKLLIVWLCSPDESVNSAISGGVHFCS